MSSKRMRLVLGSRQADAVGAAIDSWFSMREGEDWTAEDNQIAAALSSVSRQIARYQIEQRKGETDVAT